MSQVFDLCEQNFYRNIRNAQKVFNNKNLGNAELEQIRQALNESAQQLNKMQIEYSLNRTVDFKNKINLFKDQLKDYKKKLQHYQQIAKNKEQESSEDKLFEMETQDKGVQSLIQAKRRMYENQALSNEAALGIQKNNHKLRKDINLMGQIHNELTIAQKLLGSIKEKMSKNKKILIFTIFILLLVTAFVIYTYTK